jgi:Phage Tail Protein X.
MRAQMNGFDPDQHPTSLQLQRYLRTLLSGSGRPEELIESHLQECAECRKRLQEEIDSHAIRAAAQRDELPAAAGLSMRVEHDRRADRPGIAFPAAVAAVLAVVAGVMSLGTIVGDDDATRPEVVQVSTPPSAVVAAAQSSTAPGVGRDIPTPPDHEKLSPVPPQLPERNPEFPKTHVVVADDTLTELARRYYGRNGYSQWTTIRDANPTVNEEGTNLVPGMELVIPKPSARDGRHVVVAVHPRP